eukprot:779191-Prorocentrum_minimum.AAC.1
MGRLQSTEGIFSRWTNQTQEARACSRNGPIGVKRGEAKENAPRRGARTGRSTCCCRPGRTASSAAAAGSQTGPGTGWRRRAAP